MTAGPERWKSGCKGGSRGGMTAGQEQWKRGSKRVRR